MITWLNATRTYAVTRISDGRVLWTLPSRAAAEQRLAMLRPGFATIVESAR